jgi:rare lipoprotein A
MKKLVSLTLLGIIFASSVHAAGWGTVARKPYLLGPRPSCGFGQPVLASFYYTGRITSSGESFRPDGISVAHRSLPFGTRVTFTNPRNDRTVSATVNDRGPFGTAARIGVKFDLSRGAARAIGMHGSQWLCASY